MTAKQYTLKGINDDVETCMQCGKTGLKRVMWLCELDGEGNETENIIHVGSVCGSKLLTGRKNKKAGDSLAKVSNGMRVAKKWHEKGHSLQTIKDVLYHRMGIPCYFGLGEYRGKLIIYNEYGNHERANEKFFVIAF